MSTITVGHVALQVFDIRAPKDLTAIQPLPVDRFAKWERAMVPIWPLRHNSVDWPPPLLHDNDGLSELIRRWNPPS